jgi:hypothetical protein
VAGRPEYRDVDANDFYRSETNRSVNTPKQLSKTITVRARAAFAVTMAEHVLPATEFHEYGHSLASNAIETMWRWRNGQAVNGSDVYECVGDNEDEDGLIFIVEAFPEGSVACSAFLAVISAILYAAWHAYRRDGQHAMPEAVCDVGEEDLEDLYSYAKQTPAFDVAFADRVADYLVRHHPLRGRDELDSAIDRQTISSLRRKP